MYQTLAFQLRFRSVFTLLQCLLQHQPVAATNPTSALTCSSRHSPQAEPSHHPISSLLICGGRDGSPPSIVCPNPPFQGSVCLLSDASLLHPPHHLPTTSSLSPLAALSQAFSLHVLPGSFNPPHDGHARMMAAALHTPAQPRCPSPPSDALSLFELSVVNVDKEPPTLPAIVQRVQRYFEPDSPLRQSALLLSRSPRFTDKSSVLHPFTPHTRAAAILIANAICFHVCCRSCWVATAPL
jgi:hypothetical protein